MSRHKYLIPPLLIVMVLIVALVSGSENWGANGVAVVKPDSAL